MTGGGTRNFSQFDAIQRGGPRAGSKMLGGFGGHGPFDGRDSETCSQEVVDSSADQAWVCARNPGNRAIGALASQRSVRIGGQTSGFREGGLEPRPHWARLRLDVGTQAHWLSGWMRGEQRQSGGWAQVSPSPGPAARLSIRRCYRALGEGSEGSRPGLGGVLSGSSHEPG